MTVTPLGTGVYFVQFSKVGIGGNAITGNVQVTAFGADANHCTLSDLWLIAGSATVVVMARCFDPAGNYAPNNAFIALTNRS